MQTQVPLVISSLLCKKSIGKKMSFNFMCTKNSKFIYACGESII